jgi:hypothetical protein
MQAIVVQPEGESKPGQVKPGNSASTLEKTYSSTSAMAWTWRP